MKDLQLDHFQISIIIVVCVLAFCLFNQGIAFSAESISFKLAPGALDASGNSRASSAYKIKLDAFGQSCISKAQSSSFIFSAGFIPFIQFDAPFLKKNISNQTWCQRAAPEKVFDLDDYFQSPLGLAMTYSVSGNKNITISIDPQTNEVSLSQAVAWFGAEVVYFTATDINGETGYSNSITLTVEQTPGGGSGNVAPRIGSAIPAKQSLYPNEELPVEVKVSDNNGSSDISSVFLIMNDTISMKYCVYVMYDKAAKKLYIRDDKDVSWGTGYAPGSAQIIENSYAKLDYAKSTISASGNTLTVKLSIIPKTAFTGVKKLFVKVTDKQGAYDGFSQKNEICIFKKPTAPF